MIPVHMLVPGRLCLVSYGNFGARRQLARVERTPEPGAKTCAVRKYLYSSERWTRVVYVERSDFRPDERIDARLLDRALKALDAEGRS